MGSFVWPLPGFSRISSPYGYRTFNGSSEFHLGVDIPAPSGTDIHAARPGKVTKAEYSGSYGNLIILEHDNGYSTRYAHQSRFAVSVGDTVKVNQKIGEVGTTGNSTGNHLHFEIRKNGDTVNPLDYVSQTDSVDNYTGDTGSSSSASGSSGSGISSDTTKQTKDITWATLKSSTGTQIYKKTDLSGKPVFLTNGAEILIENDQVYAPVIESGIKLERVRKGAPSKLTFTCMKDEVLNFQEGNPVSFRYNSENVFFGYVFSKSRTDNRKIKVICYDQLRYLKNEDTLSYVNKTYSELLGMIADD